LYAAPKAAGAALYTWSARRTAAGGHVGAFRRLNIITAADKYPLPNMADLSARLAGCSYFSKLDLQKGYLQVPVAAADVPETAVITPFGLFEFVRMPFGLKKCRHDLSEVNGLDFEWASFCFCQP
jgi:hypothetical protein